MIFDAKSYFNIVYTITKRENSDTVKRTQTVVLKKKILTR